jgi:hypothetical protein
MRLRSWVHAAIGWLRSVAWIRWSVPFGWFLLVAAAVAGVAAVAAPVSVLGGQGLAQRVAPTRARWGIC